MFKVEPTGPFCSQQASLFQLPQWFPESHPNLWQEITLTRLFLEPVTSPHYRRKSLWHVDGLVDTVNIQVVCCLLFCFCSESYVVAVFFSRLSVNCVCVTFGFNDSGVRSVFGDLHGLVLHSFPWGYSMLQVSSMTFSIYWVTYVRVYLYIYSSCILLQLRAYSSKYWFICRPFWQITNLRNLIHFGILLFESMFSYMFKRKTANCINFEPLKRSWGSILSVIEHAVFHLEIPPYTYCKCGVQSKCFNDSHLYMSCQT